MIISKNTAQGIQKNAQGDVVSPLLTGLPVVGDMMPPRFRNLGGSSGCGMVVVFQRSRLH